jgi:hypothetical protein
MSHRMELERQMASALVKACLARGLTVTVNNGEDIAITRSTDYRAIMDALWQTDEEHLILHDALGRRQGWFFLVYGNDGHDLVCDYGITATTDEIWNKVVSPLSDKLCLSSAI